MKKVFKKIYSGVALGCFAFVAMLFIASALAGGANTFFAAKTGDEWLKLAACFIIISLGFNVPALIYENEKIALWLRTLLHLLTGTVVYMLTAYFAGWMKADFGAAMLYMLLGLAAAAVIWLCIFFSIRARAKKINEKIKQKQQ